MLKIATVFSGIGAFKFALKRLNFPHKTIFACDNSDINLTIDYDKELKTIKCLKSPKEKEEYCYKLYENNSKKHNFIRDTYLANYKCDYFFKDIRLLDGIDFKRQIDILVGGSPCQSFSQIGRQMGLSDTRETLYYDYARIIQEIKPKVFIYENVSNLLRHDKGKTWNIMQNVFGPLGYVLKYQLLDNRNYNIPQDRKRIFIVAFKNAHFANNFEFPKPEKLKFSMQDFF
ncbi:DNA cytosine methyltransferase [Campylobacter sp. LR286c]|uniref:DNA cytosine methyltransferase n=1 Tax=Campylobacter sp. LR286c TaxID=2593545 RepID=UPI0021DF54F3|nr:DNA (cytosine-5-)-methyltransferase [Campylobacter sp. LR286c]